MKVTSMVLHSIVGSVGAVKYSRTLEQSTVQVRVL